MITTLFDNIRDIRADSVVLDMPYPVRADEYVEIDGVSMIVISVAWVVETGRPITLVARVK